MKENICYFVYHETNKNEIFEVIRADAESLYKEDFGLKLTLNSKNIFSNLLHFHTRESQNG